MTPRVTGQPHELTEVQIGPTGPLLELDELDDPPPPPEDDEPDVPDEELLLCDEEELPVVDELDELLEELLLPLPVDELDERLEELLLAPDVELEELQEELLLPVGELPLLDDDELDVADPDELHHELLLDDGKGLPDELDQLLLLLEDDHQKLEDDMCSTLFDISVNCLRNNVFVSAK